MEERRPVVSGQRVRRVKVERAKALRRSMTTAERVLWQALRNGRLAGLRFRRQQVIAGFIVDFYCHAARMVIEVDGAIHQETTAYDAARDAVLVAHGLRVLRFTNDQLMADRASVLAQIGGACVQRLPAARQLHAINGAYE